MTTPTTIYSWTLVIRPRKSLCIETKIRFKIYFVTKTKIYSTVETKKIDKSKKLYIIFKKTNILYQTKPNHIYELLKSSIQNCTYISKCLLNILKCLKAKIFHLQIILIVQLLILMDRKPELLRTIAWMKERGLGKVITCTSKREYSNYGALLWL